MQDYLHGYHTAISSAAVKAESFIIILYHHLIFILVSSSIAHRPSPIINRRVDCCNPVIATSDCHFVTTKSCWKERRWRTVFLKPFCSAGTGRDDWQQIHCVIMYWTRRNPNEWALLVVQCFLKCPYQKLRFPKLMCRRVKKTSWVGKYSLFWEIDVNVSFPVISLISSQFVEYLTFLATQTWWESSSWCTSVNCCNYLHVLWEWAKQDKRWRGVEQQNDYRAIWSERNSLFEQSYPSSIWGFKHRLSSPLRFLTFFFGTR